MMYSLSLPIHIYIHMAVYSLSRSLTQCLEEFCHPDNTTEVTAFSIVLTFVNRSSHTLHLSFAYFTWGDKKALPLSIPPYAFALLHLSRNYFGSLAGCIGYKCEAFSVMLVAQFSLAFDRSGAVFARLHLPEALQPAQLDDALSYIHTDKQIVRFISTLGTRYYLECTTHSLPTFALSESTLFMRTCLDCVKCILPYVGEDVLEKLAFASIGVRSAVFDSEEAASRLRAYLSGVAPEHLHYCPTSMQFVPSRGMLTISGGSVTSPVFTTSVFFTLLIDKKALKYQAQAPVRNLLDVVCASLDYKQVLGYDAFRLVRGQRCLATYVVEQSQNIITVYTADTIIDGRTIVSEVLFRLHGNFLCAKDGTPMGRLSVSEASISLSLGYWEDEDADLRAATASAPLTEEELTERVRPLLSPRGYVVACHLPIVVALHQMKVNDTL